MLIAPTGPRVGPGHPLQRHSALHHPRVSLSRSRHGLGRKRAKQSSDIILRALPGSAGPAREPEEPHRVHEGARQLLGVSALAFFSFLAIVAKDRATSPIIPPLLPTLTVSAGDAGSSSTKPEPARATAENPDAGSSSPVKNRRLLRAVWGMATAPVKLVDSLLFPEEALVGSKAKPATTAVSTSAPAPKQAKAGRHAAAAPAPAADSISAAVPEAAPAAAAAGEALNRLSDRVSALATAMPDAAAVSTVSSTSTSTSTTPDFLVQLQEAVSRLVSTQQQQQQASAQDEAAHVQDADSSADATAALAALRMLVGPDAMSLLPVLLVTAATAAAGLMLASAMAGVAGLVDKRQAMTPAQRAAQAALLDSPLRPIVCQTWPGFLPMLPSSIEPNYYRWRDTDGPATAPAGSSSSSSSSSSVSGAAAAASAAASGPKEHPLDQEWWSFAQIQALRLMPELTSKFGPGNSNSAGSTAASKAPTSASASSAAAGTATGAGAAIAAVVDAAAAAAPTPARSFEHTKDSLLQAATAAVADKKRRQQGDADPLAALDGSSSTDGAVLLGEAWELALQLAAVDSLASPDTAWDLTHGFGAGAPTQLLAEVVCLLPAAVVAVRAGVSAGCPDWQAGSISCWEQASLLICMLLDPATTGLGRLQAVCESIGLVGTAAAPDVLQGVLQEHCQHLLCQTGEAEAIPDLIYGRVPGLEDFLQRGKQQRVQFAAAALNSSIMAASVAAELWGEAVGEHAASAASPSAAAAVWEQPRTVLLHAQLLHELLHDVLPAGSESLVPLAADLLDRSTEATGELNFHALRLLATQAGPGVGPAADAALHKQIHAAASAPGVLEAALRPVSAAAEWSGEDEEVADTVLAVMELSVLAVKLPETPALFKLRPAWPAAQQLAILDSMLLPSASAQVLRWFAASHGHPSMLAVDRVLPRMLTLLPAAVVNVRTFLEQRLPAAAQHSSGQAGREDATDACLRMYRCMLSTAAKEYEVADYFWEVLSCLGLEPAAVAAAVDALREDDHLKDVVDKADAASRAAYSPVMRFTGGLLPMLPYSSDERLDAAARPALALSCAVCLSLLLHLGDTERWVDVEFSPTEMEHSDDEYNWPPGTRVSLALLAAQYAGSSVFELPGSEAAAAVLLALHQQLQQSPGARPTSKFAIQTPEQLLADESESHLIVHASWAAGMAAALALPQGMDLDGDEQWLEREAYSGAFDSDRLPYSVSEGVTEPEWGAGDSSSDEEDAEGWEQQQEEEEEEQGREEGDSSSDEEDAEGWEQQQEEEEEEDVEEEQEEEEGSSSADEISAAAAADWEAAVSEEESLLGFKELEAYFEEIREAGLVTHAAVRTISAMREPSVTMQVAFKAAVFTASVADCAGEEAAVKRLRELGSAAPTWVVVKVCAVLPRALLQYRAAAADPDSAAGDGSSFDLAARLMAAVLPPAAAAGAAGVQDASRKGQAAVKGGSGGGQAQGQQQSKQQKRKQRKKRQRKDRGESPAQAAQLQGKGQEPAAQAKGRVSAHGAAVGAVEPVVEGKEERGAPECELIPTVKKLLGLPVDPSDSALSSADAVPNRVALLLCQAMLMRGDDAQAKLQAAVGYLATAATQAPCSEAVQVQVPSMLCNCMEALFTSEDWDSPTGSARQVLSTLSVALPWQAYMSLQKQLMAKGLVRELEVPAEFE